MTSSVNECQPWSTVKLIGIWRVSTLRMKIYTERNNCWNMHAWLCARVSISTIIGNIHAWCIRTCGMNDNLVVQGCRACVKRSRDAQTLIVRESLIGSVNNYLHYMILFSFAMKQSWWIFKSYDSQRIFHKFIIKCRDPSCALSFVEDIIMIRISCHSSPIMASIMGHNYLNKLTTDVHR